MQRMPSHTPRGFLSIGDTIPQPNFLHEMGVNPDRTFYGWAAMGPPACDTQRHRHVTGVTPCGVPRVLDELPQIA